MKFRTNLMAGLLAGLCLCGCSRKAEVPVTGTCSMKLSGLEMTAVIKAPGAHQKVTSIELKCAVPADSYDVKDWDEAMDEESRKALIDQLAETYKTDPQDISLSTEDGHLVFSMIISDQSMKDLFGMDSSQAIIYQDLIDYLQASRSASCD